MDWEVKSLGQVAVIQSGIAKNANAQLNDPMLVRYLRVANVQDGFLDLSEVSQIEIDRGDLKRFAVLNGDVLMNEGGDLDKLGRGSIWSGEFSPCVHQNHVFVVRSGPSVDPRFLNVWTSGSAARRYFVVAGKQTTNLASINKTALGRLPVALPSFNEQSAIAITLTDVERLIIGLKQLISKKRNIKQAIMQQLLTGKTRLPGFGDAMKKVRLGDFVDFYKGKGLPKSEIIDGGDSPCIHYGELFTKYGAIVRIVSSRANSFNGMFLSQKNDVLMPTSDVTPRGLATASVVEESGVVLGGDILVIRPNSKLLNGAFLAYQIRESKHQILKLVTGSTVYHLYASDMRRFEFSLPSIAEQMEIQKYLRLADEEILLQESKLEKIKLLRQGMMQELLTGRTRLI